MAAEELGARYGKPVGEEENETGGPKFAVIGLGKLGTKELIYGSDLDIIFVYSKYSADGKDLTETELFTTGPKKIAHHEYFIKLGQRIISILTLRTREGTVFPVDMRLRPSGSAGPLVLTGASLIKYQRERAEVWEAQAMIKARTVAGDINFGEKIVKSLNETIYARGLKSDELSEIRRIRERMENEIAKEGQGRYNIKSGKGAIVDIEFLTQALQMKFGAKLATLQTPSILSALNALLAEGLMTTEDHRELTAAYSFFSKITVKLRVVQDRAGGDIIEGSKEIATLSRRLGYNKETDSSKTFLDDYIALSLKVREIYTRVLDAL
jgi:glutamate-ammonia-ligase adenylyltransferase